MQQKQNSNSKATHGCLELVGIDNFKKSLEKYFFAEASILPDTTVKDFNTHITINLNCNFNLTESFLHLNGSNWGGFYKSAKNLEHSGFELAVNDLQQINKTTIVIEEIAIHFKDTSIFIIKVPNQTITNQLSAIFSAIRDNFVHFTKGLTEIPYEIFVPVFEQTIDTDDKSLWEMTQEKTSYFDYWGIYFDSEIDQDPLVYDLKNKTLLDGDFFLLNK